MLEPHFSNKEKMIVNLTECFKRYLDAQTYYDRVKLSYFLT